MSDLWDDPTWACDYWRRCENKLLKLILRELEDCKNMEDIQNVYDKWDQRYKKNEEDDK